ncbi:MAG: elongation factor Ts [Clostridia bacterium]|nr:elongation factor Ts [Clostridia bacterium]MBQ7788202.1 elongation factor Ts [Clostridia bacterium]
MAAITAKMVADLRTKTGCGMMECKKALTEANGDFDEAIKVLREKGLSVAAKKADRIAAEGVVDILVNDEGTSAAMIEVNAETDFVAKNATFLEFVQNILKTILKTRPATVEELLTKQYLDTDMTVEAKLKDMIFTIGENMNIRRFVIVDGLVSTYIHGKGTTGVIINFEADDNAKNNEGFAQFAKNIALQVAAVPVLYLNKESVPEKDIEEEKAIILAQLNNDPKNASKPAQILEKMVVGKLGKFYEKNCLLEQAYVKDDKMSVGAYVNATAKEFGGSIKVAGYCVFEKGEGLQKREDDFAAEIEKMVKG